ncbi:ferritin-like domain-containing protein [Paenibacillus chibensis]|uniref:Ferritin-like domain-containing protein n=1 Tax=Paenibacillus chibensis TaxID=59846 RepID=A0ABU6PYY0_9BACL|nr:ferritin-like domain-containing protein [Paenibacillus chibensis]MEC0369556.1 ferritin-like domain-containing protein [Paenibacillus chibensis]MED5020032.1 ferritin-like domain-containing protein [Paenibacillus chibensis]
MIPHGLYFRPATNPDAALAEDLIKSIDGEYSAVICYEQLAKLAPTEQAKKRILEIREDEQKHLQFFMNVYTHLTGQTHQPVQTETCPKEYKAGLESSFMDEQATVDFYLSLSDRAQDPYLKSQLRRIAMDEQNHAVWFLYLMSHR